MKLHSILIYSFNHEYLSAVKNPMDTDYDNGSSIDVERFGSMIDFDLMPFVCIDDPPATNQRDTLIIARYRVEVVHVKNVCQKLFFCFVLKP